ncbi:UDP-N-acetylmuramoyl-L-alanyl-D-glutamate--2,6-diaminopimelate ligase [uncultured Oscillibacter sp.]|uniref:UDP-N-acetylmuramoyl-L-alanyl-D-glutamate--2, 6-diaminopimelate ligase n=1 Tax=uncultured Oscillibacter sp. TaxID=876091 RepID=UPI0026077DD1|nr:UDP-N-acetylmuramoyl-L-alanyl-D-glutamate--2,6-diaminopimelate ligase [uncultured Oscillibacter sp.]
MKLKELLKGWEFSACEAYVLELEITGVSWDSRTVRPGDLFVAMTGFAADGHRFIPQAMEAGAAAVLCQERLEDTAIPHVRVPDSRRCLAVIGANFFGHPAESMTMIGVTGTNGKTTTTYLLKAILEARGKKVGLIGTNQNMIGSEALPTERTTPESFELQGLFARMRDGGCTHVVMEVSSHALALDRVYGVDYDVGVFTNLTQDHLDFHQTMEAYCDAKALLFQRCRTGAVNADDPWTPRLTKNAACRLLTYGESGTAELRAEDVELGADHVAFTAVYQGTRTPVRVNIPGRFMVYNTLDVLGAALALGISLEESAAVLRAVPHVKGRVEVVPTPGKDFTVLIDYAHSPDSLENVLRSVRDFAAGRTVALFGCGGDRDKTKRPRMGRAAAENADFVIVTTDNPRTERPSDIIAEILPGLEGTQTPYTVVEDRVEAIRWAMDHAGPGDVVVLCGKGHETYQEVGHEKRHMDEREIVAEHLKKTT